MGGASLTVDHHQLFHRSNAPGHIKVGKEPVYGDPPSDQVSHLQGHSWPYCQEQQCSSKQRRREASRTAPGDHGEPPFCHSLFCSGECSSVRPEAKVHSLRSRSLSGRITDAMKTTLMTESMPQVVLGFANRNLIEYPVRHSGSNVGRQSALLRLAA